MIYERHIARGIHVSNIVFQFRNHTFIVALFNWLMLMVLLYMVSLMPPKISCNTARPSGSSRPVVLVDDGKFLLVFLERALDPVNGAVVGFKPELPLVGAAVFPRLIFAVDVVSGGAPPLTLDAEEHAADKGVDRGFAGFIFTVNDV